MNKTDYPYLVETHLHTFEGSACGQSSGAEMAAAHFHAGYSAIVVTDHFFNGNCRVRGEMTWEEKVNLFCLGFENAYEEGRRLGLEVFFGFEYNFSSTEFLIYGLSKEWLLSYPGIMSDPIEKSFPKIRADGGYIIHAHPFREAGYIKNAGRIFPELTDAVEVINIPNYPEQANQRAMDYAVRCGKTKFEGSDIHSAHPTGRGMAFKEKPSSVRHLIQMAQTDCLLL